MLGREELHGWETFPCGSRSNRCVLLQACDLEEVMMDALVNDKPDFVRLFVDNGVNLGEFLTYGRLQKLYWSVSEKSLLHNLLLKKYEEKQLLLGTARAPPGHHHSDQGDRKPRFTLFEVAKVLKDFLHDSCKGFYQKTPTVSFSDSSCNPSFLLERADTNCSEMN